MSRVPPSLGFLRAVVVLDAERSSPNAKVSDLGDAIWWAVATMPHG
jgi:hypothetical protein